MALRLHADITVQLGCNNSAFAYNGESGGYWDDTRVTLTYFANVS